MKRVAILFLAFATTVSLMSCDEELLGPNFSTEEQSDIDQDLLMESVFSDLSQTVDEASSYNTNGGRLAQDVNSCATFSLITEGDAAIVTVDFGEGCKGNDDKVRSGKVIVTITPNATITTLQEYVVDGFAIKGTTTTTNVSFDSTGITNRVVLTGGEITWPDGSVGTRESDRTHKWSYNAEDSFTLTIDGTAAGVNRNGVVYASEITEDLLYTLNCITRGTRIPVSGQNVVTTEDHVIFFDFGDGNCDNTVSVTVGTNSGEISL